jgi:hypothetical protein
MRKGRDRAALEEIDIETTIPFLNPNQSQQIGLASDSTVEKIVK